MLVQFDYAATYWEFKRSLSNAFYQTHRQLLETNESLERKAKFRVFTQYAHAYLGEDYYAQLGAGSDDDES